MSGFLKSLTNAVFVTEDSEVNSKPAKTTTQGTPSTSTPTVTFNPSGTMPYPVYTPLHTGVPEPHQTPLSNEDRAKIEAKIAEIFAAMNDPKPSYHEYKVLVDSMRSIISGPSLYKAALVSLGAQNGSTIDTKWLLSNTESIIASLHSEIQQFESAIDNRLQVETLSYEQNISAIDEEMKTLVARQQELLQKRSEHETNMRSSTIIADAKKQYYRATIECKIRDIDNDRSVISTL